MRKADCLIVGGGLAGWTAARQTVAAGLDTVLLQDGMGASPWVHGFSAPVVPGDTPEAFYRDTIESGQGLSDPALARALCMDAPEVFDELRAMGLPFNREGGGYQALRPLGSSFPRVVSIGNETGVAVLERVRADLDGRVTELAGMRAVRLLTDGTRVCGALAFDTRGGRWEAVAARAVVLACGGYCGVYPVSTNKRDSGGDGVAMAYDAGAALCDLECIQFEPSAAVWPQALLGTSVITTLFFEGAVMRNRDGERFMLRYGPEGERVGKDVMALRFAAEIAAGRGSPHGGVYMDNTGVGEACLKEKYSMYVERYRNVGIDLTRDWVEIAPAPHTSLGGVRVDADGCTGAEGLFACGEVMGGLHGANRIGGSAGLETLVFGRRAGRAAAAFAAGAGDPCPRVELPRAGGSSIAAGLEALRADMRGALWTGANVIRDDEGLRAAAKAFSEGLARLDGLRGADDAEVFARLRLRNDMTAALLTAGSALARTDSVGCHYRSDCPRKPSEAYHVVVRKGSGGSPEIIKEAIPG